MTHGLALGRRTPPVSRSSVQRKSGEGAEAGGRLFSAVPFVFFSPFPFPLPFLAAPAADVVLLEAAEALLLGFVAFLFFPSAGLAPAAVLLGLLLGLLLLLGSSRAGGGGGARARARFSCVRDVVHWGRGPGG
jgi:hypothetical protein